MTKSECWLCYNELTDEDKSMCKCCSLSESKDRYGNLCCFKCSRIMERLYQEKHFKKYGKEYWER